MSSRAMWRPTQPGEVPTLGWDVIDWIHEHLASPDGHDREPMVLYPEQELFIARLYEIDPLYDRRKIRRAVLSRPKGWGKSPLLAAIAAAEALGPVVFDGWDSDGQPVGRAWSTLRTPWVQLSAVSEDQTRNAWAPLLEMLREGNALSAYPGLDPMETFVNLPGKGRIEFVTASARSREGNRPVFCVLDQTETWVPGNGGVKLAATMRRNLGKTGGTSIESPNAYLPGEGSVAEESAQYWQTILEGRAVDEGLYYDHREAPAETDLADPASLMAGLCMVYGDSAKSVGGHIDLDRIRAEVYDPATDPQDARRFYLNQITYASDSYLAHHEVAGAEDKERKVARGEAITLGFDGSRGQSGDTKRKPDATGLVGCCMSDGHEFQIGAWEAEDGPGQEDWTPPIVEIDAAVDNTFKVYNVVAFYADPAKDWRSKVGEWEAKYGAKVKVKVKADHPFEWWMTGGRSVFIERAIKAFSSAIRTGEMTHDGSFRFVQHMLNARRRIRHQHLTLGKENEYSPNKIDLCVCGVLAYQAYLDCKSQGIGAKRKATGKLRRIR